MADGEHGETEHGETMTPPSSMESLRSRVYSIRREVSEVYMPPPPRNSVFPSDCMPCSGVVKADSKGYNYFPESCYFKSAFKFFNFHLAESRATKTFSSSSCPFGRGKFVLKIMIFTILLSERWLLFVTRRFLLC